MGVNNETFSAASMCEYVKYFCSTIVVHLLILVVIIGVSMQYCVLQLHPIALFILLILALTLLAYIEALHYACVAVEKWDMTSHADDYPRACATQQLVNNTAKVKKFLVGRQFFVIFVVFLIAQITSFEHIPKDFANMPEIMVSVLIQCGLPGVAIVLTYGQLISQLYVEEFTLPAFNVLGVGFVTRLCFAAEWIGICHFSHLLFYIMSRIFCGKIRKAEEQMRSDDALLVEPGSPAPEDDQSLTAFDVVRYLWSTFATIGSMVIVAAGINLGYYVLPTPPAVTFIIFFCTLTMLFYLEGLMIAIVATQYWDKETFREAYPRAYMIHELVNRPDNVKRFIIGRQFCTVLVCFLIAQVSTFPHWPSDGYNPIGFYIIIKSGLVGVMIVLSCGQLMPELLAAQYPLRFMDMYGSYSIVYISLFFDAVGVGHAAWLVFFATRKYACSKHISDEGVKSADQTPGIMRVKSAELLAVTGSVYGGASVPTKPSAVGFRESGKTSISEI